MARVSLQSCAWVTVSDWVKTSALSSEDLFTARHRVPVGEGAAIGSPRSGPPGRVSRTSTLILMNPWRRTGPRPRSDVREPCTPCAPRSARATDEQLPTALATYMDRLPVEYAAYTIRDATTRGPGLCATGAFLDWAVQHQEIIN